MSITIEAGRFYRTRDGQKVGPMVPGLGKAFNSPDSFSTCGWYQDGRVSIQGERPDDIVAEWSDAPPSPVVIETKKKIKPGTYPPSSLSRSSPMTELTTEPGTLALAISDALVQGREIRLSRLQVAALSEYERQVLQRTALRLNRRISYNFDTGTVSIEKAHP